MARLRSLQVKGFLAIKEASIDLVSGKVMLVGPNAAGKSSIIRAMELLLKSIGALRGDEAFISPELVNWDSEKAELRLDVEGGSIGFSIPKEKLEYKILIETHGGSRDFTKSTGQLNMWRESSALKEMLNTLLGDETNSPIYVHLDDANHEFLLYLREDGLPKLDKAYGLAEALADSEYLMERAIEHLPIVVPYIEKIHVTRDKVKFKVNGRWIDHDNLASGYKKALAYVVALEGAQLVREEFNRDVIVAIEEFEGKLHYDLAIDLLEYMTRLQVGIIVETHVMLHVRAALRRGWSVYYIKDGVSRRLESDSDLKRSDLFEVEYKAYEYAEAA